MSVESRAFDLEINNDFSSLAEVASIALAIEIISVASIALAFEMNGSCNLSFSPGLGVICENTA